LTGDPIASIKLLEDPGKNLVVIMKDGEVYKKHPSVIGSKADMARTYQSVR
jgi:hypothetical protein